MNTGRVICAWQKEVTGACETGIGSIILVGYHAQIGRLKIGQMFVFEVEIDEPLMGN